MLFIGAISARHYEWHVCYKFQKQSFYVPHNKVDNLKTHGIVAVSVQQVKWWKKAAKEKAHTTK